MPRAAETVHRLIEAGLLSTGDVVDGGVTVVDLSRSNPVWLVDAGPAGRYVAKVVAPDRGDLQGSGMVETMLYERIWADPAVAAVAPVPPVAARLGDLLVLASWGESDGLGGRLRARGPAAADGRLLGEALGRWRQAARALSADGLPGRLPWVVAALDGRRPAFLDQHPATRELGTHLRRAPALTDALGLVARSWRRQEVIHGDVRWDNVVVARDEATGDDRALLVDLEFADVGDPAWDVAGAVAEPLAHAAAVADGGHGERRMVVADGRVVGRWLREMRPFVSCLAAAYRAAAGPAGGKDLARGMAYVPARLVQAAFQHASWDPSSGGAAGLAVAGLAAALAGRPNLLAGMLRDRESMAGRGGRGP